MIRIVAALLFGLIVTASACDLPGIPVDPPAQACTAIGCESAVAFNLDADLVNGTAYRLEACVGEDCASETVEVPAGEGGNVVGTRVGRFDVGTDADRVLFLLPDGDYAGVHDVSLRVMTADGEVLADVEVETEFERQQPNGPGCPPVCWFAEVAA